MRVRVSKEDNPFSLSDSAIKKMANFFIEIDVPGVSVSLKNHAYSSFTTVISRRSMPLILHRSAAATLNLSSSLVERGKRIFSPRFYLLLCAQRFNERLYFRRCFERSRIYFSESSPFLVRERWSGARRETFARRDERARALRSCFELSATWRISARVSAS